MYVECFVMQRPVSTRWLSRRCPVAKLGFSSRLARQGLGGVARGQGGMHMHGGRGDLEADSSPCAA